MNTQRIIVVGGGYAGVMAANRAAGRGADVTLVNASANFVERIRLHEVAAASRDCAELPLASLLNPEVKFVVGWADRIHAEERTVLLADGRALGYDHLVYAVGSTSAETPPSTFGIACNRDALALSARLAGLDFGTVDVVGAGLTGVELAAEIAFARPELLVRLHTRGQVGASLGMAGGHAVQRRLERLGVKITGDEPRDVEGGDADITVMAAGFAVPTLARDSGLPVSTLGQLLVGPDLVVPGSPDIVGAGDAVLVAGASHLRMSCAAALPQGAHAVDTILDGPRPLNAGFMLQCVSLGRRDGWIQHVSSDDNPRYTHITGVLGAFAKEAMCRQILRWLRNEARKSGVFSWPAGPPLTAATLSRQDV